MKTEKVVLSFIAVLIGIVVAAGAFYLYQSTKVIKLTNVKGTSVKISLVPTGTKPSQVSLDTPADEAVVDKKTVQLSGKADPDSVVVVSTDDEDKVVTPTSSGTFTTTITLADGQNQIIVTAFTPDGQQTSIEKTVTFSTESF